MKTLIIFCLGMLAYRPFIWIITVIGELTRVRREVKRRNSALYFMAHNIRG